MLITKVVTYETGDQRPKSEKKRMGKLDAQNAKLESGCHPYHHSWDRMASLKVGKKENLR